MKDAIFKAFKERDKEHVKELLFSGQELNINLQEEDTGKTPLHFAVENHWVDIVEKLLEKGADQLVPDSNGFTALTTLVSIKDTFRKSISFTDLEIPEKLKGVDLRALVMKQLEATGIERTDKNICFFNALEKSLVKLSQQQNLSSADLFNLETLPLKRLQGLEKRTELASELEENDEDKDLRVELSTLLSTLSNCIKNEYKEYSELGKTLTGNHSNASKLIDAVKKGSVDQVSTLINTDKINPNIQLDYSGETPLYVAASLGDSRMVGLLLEQGANASIRASNLKLPLCAAAMSGSPETLGKLAGCNTCGGRPDVADALYHVAGWNDKPEQAIECAEKLLDLKKDIINSHSDCGDTPLHMAATSGFPKMAEWLVSKGANIEAGGSADITPLQRAILNNNMAVTQKLVELGANPTVNNSNNRNAKDYAAVYNKELLRILNSAAETATTTKEVASVTAVPGKKDIPIGGEKAKTHSVCNSPLSGREVSDSDVAVADASQPVFEQTVSSLAELTALRLPVVNI